MNARRRRWLGPAATLAVCAALAGRVAFAADVFPPGPVAMWVPWAAGGATDVALAKLASQPLGQRVPIENRGAAGGTLAMPILQQAKPDGYTIAQLPQPVFRAPFTRKVLWDAMRDVTPIIQLSGVTFGVLVPAASLFRTLDDLFAFARERPDYFGPEDFARACREQYAKERGVAERKGVPRG